MTHDEHLDNLFPEFSLTEDTTVKPFKYYFQKTGGEIKMVHDIVDGDTRNPSTLGWYERMYAHRKRYRFEVDSYMVNNVHSIMQAMVMRMTKLPARTLPRKETITEGGTTHVIDYTMLRHDTNWNEVIGTNPIPAFVVPFALNLYIALNANVWMDTLAGGTTLNIGSILTQCASLGEGTHFTTFGEAGYVFDPSTLGDISRADDTYTLANAWTMVDTRKIKYFLQKVIGFTTSTTIKDQYQHLIELIDKSARTMIVMSKRFNGTVIKDVTTDGIAVDEVKLPYEE